MPSNLSYGDEDGRRHHRNADGGQNFRRDRQAGLLQALQRVVHQADDVIGDGRHGQAFDRRLQT